MYSFDPSPGVDKPDNIYSQSIRDRANESLNELKDVFTFSGSKSTHEHTKEQLAQNVHPRFLNWHEATPRVKKYENAAEQLKSMVLTDSEKTRYVPQGPAIPQGPLPSPEEAMVLLQNQNSYINQIEAENRYLKNEMSSLKMKISEIIEENRRLHEELKKTVIEELLMGGNEFSKMDDLEDVFRSHLQIDSSLNKFEGKKWHLEIERLSSLHAAKTERLESQLIHTRAEIQNYEQMVEDLKAQLRMHESVPTHEDGMAFPAGAFISQTQRNMYLQTIDRLTNERDVLMDHVTSLKARVNEMTQREETAYQQMKKGVELVEQAQLEQTDAMVQKEQLAEELGNMRKRFESQVLDTQKKIEHEREYVRQENKTLIDELNTKMREMMEQHVASQQQLEKVARDKAQLLTEVEELKIQVKRYDKEYSLAKSSFNAEATSSSLQKSHAVNEVTRIRNELDQLKKGTYEERNRLKTEIEELRRRLQIAERDLVNSKEECIHCTTSNQALERELHMAKLSRDSVERCRSDDLKAMARRVEQREDDLNTFVNEIEVKHSRTTSEMDEMIKKQNKLILKLREECRRQAAQLEKLTKKHRHELSHTKKEKENLRLRLDRVVPRLKELEDQSEQHSRLHERMKERLKTMDDHSQHQAQQILDLLSKQGQLMKERQLLCREVEFFRLQIIKGSEADIERVLGSSRKHLVDDIISKTESEGSYPKTDLKQHRDLLNDDDDDFLGSL